MKNESAVPLTIVVNKEVSRETIENIFVTALEGGSNYWYFLSDKAIKKIRKAVPASVDPYLSTAMPKAILDFGVDVDINDIEDEDEVLGTISRNTMADRLQELSKDKAYKWALEAEMDEDGMDATSSDIVFQYLAFGGVIFG